MCKLDGRRIFPLIALVALHAMGCSAPRRVDITGSYSRYSPRRIGILRLTEAFKETSKQNLLLWLGHIQYFGNAGEIMADKVAASFLRYNVYEVVERQRVESAARDLGISVDDLAAGSKLEQLGKKLEMDAVLVGTVGTMHETSLLSLVFARAASCDLKLVDIKSGTVLWTTHLNSSDLLAGPISALALIGINQSLDTQARRIGRELAWRIPEEAKKAAATERRE